MAFIADYEIRTRVNQSRVVGIEHVFVPILLFDVNAFRISAKDEP